MNKLNSIINKLINIVSFNEVVSDNEKNMLDTKEKLLTMQVAKNMSPKKEIWESMDFIFEDIEGDSYLCNATFPSGWSAIILEDSNTINIIDGNGLKRGTIFNYNLLNKSQIYMRLNTFYSVHSVYTNEKQNEKLVFFGNEEEILYNAGTVNMKNVNPYKNHAIEKEFRKKLSARKYGDEYYSRFDKYTPYYSEEELSKQTVKQKMKMYSAIYK